MMKTNIPVFSEIKTKAIIDDLNNSYYNFLLEGDNLHSLKLLEKTHKGRIDVIYIDPPYNTGNKDFVYNDTYVDNVDGFRHSKWLSFMAKRLSIARNLLSVEGIIFISIDDNECANLKLLCDEIFGEENFISEIIIKSNPRGSQSKKAIASLHEYLLVYAKSSAHTPIIGHSLTEEMASEYKYSDENGSFRLLGLRQRGGFWRATERPKLFYPFYVDPLTLDFSIEPKEGYSVEIYPYQPSTGEKGTWRWSKEKVKNEADKLVARSVKRDGELVFDIYQKDYLNSNDTERRTKARSIWDEKEMNYQNAATELKDIFYTSPFTYAKPTYLIKQALRMMDYNHQEIVLDFFAGSGTTGQAVLELNKEDGGNRQFILCTNNENNICEEITYERLKTVITGKRKDGTFYSNGIPANLLYYKTAFIEKNKDELCDELLENVTEMIQIHFATSIKNENIVVIQDDDDIDEFENKFDTYKDIQAVFINQNVLLSSTQEKLLDKLNTFNIPDYYFDSELREVGEIW